MGDPEVTMRDEDVRRIGDYVKPWLRDLVDQIIPRPAIAGIDQQRLEKQFESMDKRFEELISHIDKRFESVDRRFESMDKRFGDLITHTDKRFESMDKRFDDVHESLKRTQWLIGLGFVLLTAVVTVFGLLA